MTYAEFQAYMAKYGFVSCPLTEEQFTYCIATGMNVDTLYGVACDVNAGIDFLRAVEINNEDLSI